MAMITCDCGNSYDSSFKFCPECASPNPNYKANKPKLKPIVDEEEPSAPAKKKFTKVGESSLRSDVAASIAPAKKTPTIVRPNVQKTPVKPEPEYEEYEEDEDEQDTYESDEDYEDKDYDDESKSEEEYEDEDYEDDDESSEEEYEEEDEDESYEEVPITRINSKAKTLGAPSPTKNIRQAKEAAPKKPATKKVTTKSSLAKKAPAYDPNNDGYYDDRLPAILDEVTKTSHMDVYLKIALAIVCIAALITYCIFYVQV